MIKKAIVTGGAGFIGSNVVKKLIDENWKVIVIDNLSTGHYSNIEKFNVEFYELDILNYDEIAPIFENVDVVFHLAASVGRQKSIDFPIEDSKINVLGTINVLEAMRAHKVKRIVYSSSAAIYGELLGSEIDENHPIKPNCQYGVSKLAAEKMAEAYHYLYDFEVISLRYFNIFGINQRYDLYGNVIPIFVDKILNNQGINIYGDGLQTRDFIDVEDIAELNFVAATSKVTFGAYNIGTGKEITVNYLAEKIYDLFGKEKNIKYLPNRIGDVKHCKANIKKVNKELDFYPNNDFEKEIKEYIEWYKTNNQNENI